MGRAETYLLVLASALVSIFGSDIRMAISAVYLGWKRARVGQLQRRLQRLGYYRRNLAGYAFVTTVTICLLYEWQLRYLDYKMHQLPGVLNLFDPFSWTPLYLVVIAINTFIVIRFLANCRDIANYKAFRKKTAWKIKRLSLEGTD